MKKLILKFDYKATTAKLEGRHAAPSHVDTIISRDTVVIAPDGRTHSCAADSANCPSTL